MPHSRRKSLTSQAGSSPALRGRRAKRPFAVARTRSASASSESSIDSESDGTLDLGPGGQASRSSQRDRNSILLLKVKKPNAAKEFMVKHVLHMLALPLTAAGIVSVVLGWALPVVIALGLAAGVVVFPALINLTFQLVFKIKHARYQAALKKDQTDNGAKRMEETDSPQQPHAPYSTREFNKHVKSLVLWSALFNSLLAATATLVLVFAATTFAPSIGLTGGLFAAAIVLAGAITISLGSRPMIKFGRNLRQRVTGVPESLRFSYRAAQEPPTFKKIGSFKLTYNDPPESQGSAKPGEQPKASKKTVTVTVIQLFGSDGEPEYDVLKLYINARKPGAEIELTAYKHMEEPALKSFYYSCSIEEKTRSDNQHSPALKALVGLDFSFTVCVGSGGSKTFTNVDVTDDDALLDESQYNPNDGISPHQSESFSAGHFTRQLLQQGDEQTLQAVLPHDDASAGAGSGYTGS